MNYEYLQRFFKPEVGYATQSDIANALGVSRQRVHNWKERGIPQEIQDKVLAMKAKRK